MHESWHSRPPRLEILLAMRDIVGLFSFHISRDSRFSRFPFRAIFTKVYWLLRTRAWWVWVDKASSHDIYTPHFWGFKECSAAIHAFHAHEFSANGRVRRLSYAFRLLFLSPFPFCSRQRAHRRRLASPSSKWRTTFLRTKYAFSMPSRFRLPRSPYARLFACWLIAGRASVYFKLISRIITFSPLTY